MRISRQLMLMDICDVIAKRSTCPRGNIGALVWDPRTNDIVSTGYNGSRPHEPHCLDVGCMTSAGLIGCQRTEHAEANAIERAESKVKKHLNQMHLFCSSSPCKACAEKIYNAYIPRLYYRHPYRDKTGLDYLVKATDSLLIFRVMPNGAIISERTGQLVDPRDIQ